MKTNSKFNLTQSLIDSVSKVVSNKSETVTLTESHQEYSNRHDDAQKSHFIRAKNAREGKDEQGFKKHLAASGAHLDASLSHLDALHKHNLYHPKRHDVSIEAHKASKKAHKLSDVANAHGLPKVKLDPSSMKEEQELTEAEKTILVTMKKSPASIRGGGVKRIKKSDYDPNVHNLAEARRKAIAKIIAKKNKAIKLSGKAEFVDVNPKLAESINEVITKKTRLGDVIKDFVKSDHPKFTDKSKKERIRMALGAYYAKQKE